jgi:anti-anti-sigma factor
MNDIFETSRFPQTGLAILIAPAEVDALNASKLRDGLMFAAENASIVVLDMTATTFCDSRGSFPMKQAGDHLRAKGGNLRVACSERVKTLLSITGDDKHLSVFTSMAEAADPRPRAEDGLASAA